MSIIYKKADSTFYVDVKNRVNNYFAEQGISPKGNIQLYAKAFVLIFLTIGVYVVLLWHPPQSLILNLLLWTLLGCLNAFIGFNVMHDASHGSFSESRMVNQAMLLVCEYMQGISLFLWDKKHVIIHHRYTNTDDDDDLQSYPLLRLITSQKPLKFHRYQHRYALVLYCFLYLAWVFVNDFLKYFRRKVHTTPIKKQSYTWRTHLVFFTAKIWFVFAYIVIPISVLGPFHALLGFACFAFACGFLSSIVFQLAHVVETSKYVYPEEGTNVVHAPWAVKQVEETCDFATDKNMVTVLTGGLNFQTIHHLFPGVSHIHYPAIQHLVIETCRDHGITYNHLSLGGVCRSHVRKLKILGTMP
jgi:linoleoyl-CoA desaturase